MMGDNKNVKLSPFVEIRELYDFQKIAGNLYKSVLIIAKRANQLNVSTNEELREKLQEFGSTTDDMEEIHENVEQIEISKYYERLPKSALVATHEFLEGKVYFREQDQVGEKKENSEIKQNDTEK